jgi:hypothetical protein
MIGVTLFLVKTFGGEQIQKMIYVRAKRRSKASKARNPALRLICRSRN